MKLLLATRNRHKLEEISRLLSPLKLELIGAKDAGVPEVAEDGRTIEENAGKKAQRCARAARMWALADDTGLEVEALGKAPGVYSARYAGAGCDYAANNGKLLNELKGLGGTRRRAVFRCVVALSSPQGETLLKEGRLEGSIALKPAGSHGFGYDPVFWLQEFGKTLAELTPEEKDRVSHRAKAIAAIRPDLEKLCSALRS